MSAANTKLEIRGSLRSLVTNKFNASRTSQSLVFSDTQLATLQSKAGLPFQLRFCPTLSKKPTNNKHAPPSSESSGPPEKRVDPFEDPSPDLLVARIPHLDHCTHNLILNKFPVIANHFILATRENKHQTHLLEPSDLGLTHACLHAWHDDPDAADHDLYAFFNSGQYSGASQPHRHLQLLPVEDMREIQDPDTPQSSPKWILLCDQMSTPAHPNLPLYFSPKLRVVHLATPLSPTLTQLELHQKYLLLLNAAYLVTNPALSATSPTQLLNPLPVSSLDPATVLSSSVAYSLVSPTGEVLFSYNLAMTRSTMAILPRRADDAIIPGLSRSSVSLNGTILAGTLMVKDEDEWLTLKSRPEVLDDLLCQIGVPIDEPPSGVGATKSQWKV